MKATIDPSPGTNFSTRLESYLRLGASAKQTLLADVPEKLEREEDQLQQQLGGSDLKALKDYHGYTTMLTYDRRARFVNGVAQTERHQIARDRGDEPAELTEL